MRLTFIVFILGAAFLGAVGVAVAFAMGLLRSRNSPAAKQLSQLIASAPANESLLRGMAEYLKWADEQPTIKPLSAATRRHFQQSIRQLYSPDDELFPLLKQPLAGASEYEIGSHAALVHQVTGVVFAIRVGSYLCLLRLPAEARADALRSGVAWAQSPLPTMKVDIAATFGDEWVIPNPMSPQITAFYRAAWEAAGVV